MSSEPQDGASAGACIAGSSTGSAFLVLALAIGGAAAPAVGQGLPVDAVCDPDSAHTIEAALEVEVEEVDARGGFTSIDGVEAPRTGCAVDTREGRYELAMVTDNAGPYWDVLVDRMQPAPGWQAGLEETDLASRVDTLVVEDDELIARVGDTGWFFGFGIFGEPTDADRRRLVHVAAEVVGEVGGNPPSGRVCVRARAPADKAFGGEHEVNPGMGAVGGPDGRIEYRRCRLEREGADQEITFGVGIAGLFEGRRPSGLNAPPRRLEAGVGDAALAWRDELLVRADGNVFILSGRTDASDVAPGALLPLARLLVNAADGMSASRSGG